MLDTPLTLQSSDFALFGLSQRFAQDSRQIEDAWKRLQAQTHPDKFAAEGAAAQRLAMQWSVRINEAYQRLKNPLRRAAYLCTLAGVAINAERNTAMPSDFLMQQMQWREALEEASTPAELQTLQDEVELARNSTQQTLAQAIDQQQDYQAASAAIQALMFMQRFATSLQQRQQQP